METLRNASADLSDSARDLKVQALKLRRQVQKTETGDMLETFAKELREMD